MTTQKSPLVEKGIWAKMIRRCHNHEDAAYKNYGGRGITVCKRWHKFENFYRDMGTRPEGKSLDRINNDKGYSKNNCRWATWEQQQNNRRNNKLIKYKNVTNSIGWWANKVGIHDQTLRDRIENKWPLELALKVKPNLANRNKPCSRYLTYKKQKKTIDEWCKIIEIPRDLLLQRLKYGWSTEEVLFRKPRIFKSKKINFNGKSFTLSEWAKHLGIKRSTLSMRLTKYNWPVHKALIKKG